MIKRNITTSILTTLLACSSPDTKEEYDQYPEHKKEIALYNLQQLAKYYCRKSIVDEDHFYCQVSGKYVGDFTWEEIKSVTCDQVTLEITGKYDTLTMYLANCGFKMNCVKECQSFEKAFNIYLGKK